MVLGQTGAAGVHVVSTALKQDPEAAQNLLLSMVETTALVLILK